MSFFKNRIKLFAALILTILFIFSLSLVFYFICKACFNFIAAYYAVNFLCILLILLCNLSNQAKVLLLMASFIPFLGTAFCFYVILSRLLIGKKSTKASLYVDYRPFFKGKEVNSQYFATGLRLWEDFLTCAKNAKYEVAVFTYIMTYGESFIKLFDILGDLLKRGVTVRVGIDYFGSGDLSKTPFFKALSSNGAHITIANKPKLLLTKKDNIRYHAKVLTVDDKIYLPSFNIDDTSIFKDKNCGIKLWGSTAYIFEELSPLFGVVSTQKFTQNPAYKPVLAQNKAMAEEIFSVLLQKAQKSVMIMTPYLSLDYELLKIIKRLKDKKVDIDILTPSLLNPQKKDPVTDFYGAKLISFGVDVRSYPEAFLHSKMIIIDDAYALLGSSNFDIRSGRYAFESMLIIENNGLIEQLIKDFNQSFKASLKQTYKPKSPFIERLMGLFAPFI